LADLSTQRASFSWDIFCAVVDNYGDIGVAWRLARQLAAEHGLNVRLWIDDLASFRRINSAIDANLERQSSHGVTVQRWSEPFAVIEPADVVIEMFGCEVPAIYAAAMAAKAAKPAWINLEYLSAEDWVRGCHALPSPHPRLPITRYFFFPGFVADTGGLLRERNLLAQRKLFQADTDALASFWRSLGLAEAAQAEVRVSLFCYENAAIAELIDAWAAGPQAVLCVIPEGAVADGLSRLFQAAEAVAPGAYRRGSLEMRVLPFLDQDRYDCLLWACDCNFVRGEDSFVRAQWAGRPLVWNVYPQREGQHWVKLNAFIDLYGATLPDEGASALRTFWRAWNAGRGAAESWSGFWRQREALRSHAQAWAEQLAAQGDLAVNLVKFCHKLLK
jgi:uncharacterized repeat protein (TIGR03837 family)